MRYYSNTPNISISQNLADKITDGFMDFYKEQHINDRYLTYEDFLQDIISRFSHSGFKVTWDMGGTWGDYNGKMGDVSGSIEPEMVELDNLLITHYPNMGILQYRMIINAIDKSTKKEGDFYGGSTTTGIKFLSYDKLDSVLTQYNFEQPSSLLNQNTLSEFLKDKYSMDWFVNTFPKAKAVSESLEDYSGTMFFSPEYLNPVSVDEVTPKKKKPSSKKK